MFVADRLARYSVGAVTTGSEIASLSLSQADLEEKGGVKAGSNLTFSGGGSIKLNGCDVSFVELRKTFHPAVQTEKDSVVIRSAEKRDSIGCAEFWAPAVNATSQMSESIAGGKQTGPPNTTNPCKL